MNEELQASLNGLVESLVFHIYNIDKQIAMYREGLRLLQPHGSGRMDIRYWAGKLPGRHPTPFLWKGLPAGYNLPSKRGQKLSKARSLTQRTSQKHLYVPYKIAPKGLVRQLKRREKFRETLPMVQEVVRKLQRLFDMRATLGETVRRFRISLTNALDKQHKKFGRIIDESAAQISASKAVFDKRCDKLAARAHGLA